MELVSSFPMPYRMQTFTAYLFFRTLTRRYRNPWKYHCWIRTQRRIGRIRRTFSPWPISIWTTGIEEGVAHTERGPPARYCNVWDHWDRIKGRSKDWLQVIGVILDHVKQQLLSRTVSTQRWLQRLQWRAERFPQLNWNMGTLQLGAQCALVFFISHRFYHFLMQCMRRRRKRHSELYSKSYSLV